jgi:hypothetical protein
MTIKRNILNELPLTLRNPRGLLAVGRLRIPMKR